MNKGPSIVKRTSTKTATTCEDFEAKASYMSLFVLERLKIGGTSK